LVSRVRMREADRREPEHTEMLLFVLADPVREPQESRVQRDDENEAGEEPEDPDGRRVARGPLLEEQQRQVHHPPFLSVIGLVGHFALTICWSSVTHQWMR